jgi:hypothetical protein
MRKDVGGIDEILAEDLAREASTFRALYPLDMPDTLHSLIERLVKTGGGAGR